MDSKRASRFLFNLLEAIDPEIRQRDHDFFTRFSFQFRDIATLADSLYGGRRDFARVLGRLIELLHRGYLQRSASVTHAAETRDTDWYLSQEMVSTMLYVDRFAGDLDGLSKKVDYFVELGVNLVHLMPLLDCPPTANDGGYAVRDYRSVDPRLGTIEQLAALIETFHKAGIFVQLDLVVNHISDQHDWAKRARAGQQPYRDYFYMYDDRTIPDEFELSMPEVFPQTAPGNFTWLEDAQRWVMTVFHDYQWDLNYTNPDVFLEMLDIMLFLANLGVDILRLDAVPYLWKRLGTSGQNLQEAHTILRLLRACTSVVSPQVALMAEAVVQPSEIVRYFGTDDYEGRECETAYHVSLMVLLWDSFATRSVRLLRRGLASTPPIPRDAAWFTYIRCHDDIGLGYADEDIRACGFDPFMHRRFMVDYLTGRYPGSPSTGAPFMFNPRTQDARISGTAASLLGLETAIVSGDELQITTAIDRLIMLYSVVFSIGGVPIVYYGDEIGCLNDYSYLEDPSTREDNRWMHRPKIDWGTMQRRNDPSTVEGRIFSRMRALILLRKGLPEFASEHPAEILDADNDHVFAYLRYNLKHRTLVLVNVSDVTQAASPALFEYAGIDRDTPELVENWPARVEGDRVVLRPYQFHWFRNE
jgi:amylosucrase